MFKNNSSSIGLGIASIVFGLTIFINPTGYDLKFGVLYDFSDIKWIFGGLFIIFGLIYILVTLKAIKRERKSFLICTKCEQIFERSSISGYECPNCHGILKSKNDTHKNSNITFEIPQIKTILWAVFGFFIVLLATYTIIWLLLYSLST